MTVTLDQPRPKRRRAAALQGPFVVMRMRRQTAIGEVDAPAIKELAAGHDCNEHSRVTLLGDADGRDSPCSSSRHVFLLRFTRLIGSGLRFFALPNLTASGLV